MIEFRYKAFNVNNLKGVGPECPLDKAQYFLADSFTARRVGECFKDDLSGKSLHPSHYLLQLAPVFNRLLECLELLFGQGDGHRLGFDLARPLVARATRAGSDTS